MDYLDGVVQLFSFKLAAHVALFGFFGRGNREAEEDADVAECHEAVLDALSDADRSGKVACLTGEDWREQITVEEAQRLQEEQEEASRGWFRN